MKVNGPGPDPSPEEVRSAVDRMLEQWRVTAETIRQRLQEA